ncbi:hypothetical protein WEH80_03380 [Actinomycetes bacterium KLBMP 9759]
MTTPPSDTPDGGRPGTVAGLGPDAQARSIARVVDRNTRRTDEVIAQVRQLAADLATVTALISNGRANTPAAPRPAIAAEMPPVRSWLLADDPVQAASDLAELIAWLDQVYLCFPDALLGPCWLWHPHVVEELWWLSRAHAEAYDPEIGSWLRVGDWHDRQRPGVARRVRDVIAKCDLSLHLADKQHGRPMPQAPLTSAAGGMAAAWSRGRVRPEPTVEQLAEGTAYHEIQRRRR